MLVERIVDGYYPSGSVLPNESQLGHEFGVSRSVVREAVKVLTDKGLAKIDRGNGTRVRLPIAWKSLDSVVLAARLRSVEGGSILQELLFLRRAVEPELAALAAQHATEKQLAALAQHVFEMTDLIDRPKEYRLADQHFHELVVESSGVTLAQEFFGSISGPLLVSREITNQIIGGVEHAHQDHLSIFGHIRERDPGAARDAMRTHLEWAETRVTLRSTD
jgi:DNA-binding FadR family transcriptional regulator